MFLDFSWTWEWCHEWFGVREEFDAATFDPMRPETGTARVMKGGSFLPRVLLHPVPTLAA
jgi:hypothetical protein